MDVFYCREKSVNVFESFAGQENELGIGEFLLTSLFTFGLLSVRVCSQKEPRLSQNHVKRTFSLNLVICILKTLVLMMGESRTSEIIISLIFEGFFLVLSNVLLHF